MTKTDNIDFILASASPRRKELLEKAGYKFAVIPSKIDENCFDFDAPFEFAKKLAAAKAEDVAADYPEHYVVGADTIAEVDGRIIGKASDSEHAEEIVRILFAKPHKVITGLAIINQSKKIKVIDADVTVVYPKNMTEQQIAEHIKGNTWQGKAGAYAIQETGDEFVDKIEGSLTNVMGLPMEMVNRYFQEINVLNS